MRRTDNSAFRNYDFDLEKYQEENKVEQTEVYVKPVDTTVAGLLARGAVPGELNYSTDLPPMDNMNLMEFHKLKKENAGNVSHLEYVEKREREIEEMNKLEQENKVEPKTE